MENNLKNFFTSQELNNIFEKNSWEISPNDNSDYYFNYRGEIADYYLNISFKNQIIIFEYVLDLEFPNDKIFDLLILINFINQKSTGGYFIFELDSNIIKYKVIKCCANNLTTKFLAEFFETNLNFTKKLFHDFSLYLHNLIYNEKNSKDLMELMFLNIEGHA